MSQCMLANFKCNLILWVLFAEGNFKKIMIRSKHINSKCKSTKSKETCLVHYFFVLTMLLGNKSYTIGNHVCFPFNGATFVRTMHLFDLHHCWMWRILQILSASARQHFYFSIAIDSCIELLAPPVNAGPCYGGQLVLAPRIIIPILTDMDGWIDRYIIPESEHK